MTGRDLLLLIAVAVVSGIAFGLIVRLIQWVAP
jgi:hypothetical protein